MEVRIQDAVEYISANLDASVAAVAREFAVPRGRLRRRLAGTGPKTGHSPTHTKLSAPEEVALCRYIDRLDGINLAVRPAFVTDNWTSRFIKRYGYRKQWQRKLNANRQKAEQPAVVAEYFNKLLAVLGDNGVDPEDIWPE
ncbi:hypothetical protein C8A03DRAFT_48036 [Achaetomium macrosporum]|uniref:Transposase n=1 Tax=Achaetomium macrosporum TaxID=79813 RepID=A0AAN7C1D2_9PEZI|nr:hypothetical protein C8A03DRAFT_48036 [Achaetomium macrosporum]